jgi:hypothetical protein
LQFVLYDFLQSKLYKFNNCSCTGTNAPKNTKPIAAALRIIMSYFVEFVNSFDSIFFILLVELSQLRWQDIFVLLVEKDDYK